VTDATNDNGRRGSSAPLLRRLRGLATALLSLAVTMLGLLLITFIIGRVMPIDPVLAIVGERASKATYDAVYAQLGLDKPLIVQFLYYLGDVVRGDFGMSLLTARPVSEDIARVFPATLELATLGTIIGVIFGVPMGVMAAVHRGRLPDHLVRLFGLFGYSMPIFWWALLLILLFSVQMGWTPVSGRLSVMYYVEPVTGFMLIDTLLSGEPGAFKSALSHLILPAIALGTVYIALIARITRATMLEVLQQDYIRTARAKGLAESRVLISHALANAAVPIVTIIGIGIALLISGVVVTETVFAIPGVGRLTVDAILRRDYPIIQGVILLFSAAYVLVNLLVDLSYTLFDPRIRY